MSDQELLKLAAKSIYLKGVDGVYPIANDSSGDWHEWNALKNDADAFRLMATLNINISYRENINGAFVIAENPNINFCAESLDGPHEWDATRRAVVRAAAEIGKGMKP